MLLRKFAATGITLSLALAAPNAAAAQSAPAATPAPAPHSEAAAPPTQVMPVPFSLEQYYDREKYNELRKRAARVGPEAQTLEEAAANAKAWDKWIETQSAAQKWELTYLALSAVDTIQTIECLERTTNPCEEANPLLGKSPSTGKVLLLKGGISLAHYLLFRELNKHDPNIALRAAQFSAIFQGGLVALNLHAAF